MKDKIISVLGWLAIVLFVIIYGIELLPHQEGPPATFGWLVHWPSIVTLVLWPIMIVMYAWLAKQEEKQALEEFGEDYIEYAKRTKRFIPFVI